MSPEIYQRKPYDEKSDMWSIGCILYDMCCLRPPFRGRDITDLSKRVIAGSYPSIPSRYSKDLSTAVALLLCTDPKKRLSAVQMLHHPVVVSKKVHISAGVSYT